MNTALSLYIYFKENARGTMTEKVMDIVGIPHSGSGTAIKGLSDVSFNFDSRRLLSLAVAKVRKALGRKVSFEVFNGRGIVHGSWEKK
jgi:hypothetical protein